MENGKSKNHLPGPLSLFPFLLNLFGFHLKWQHTDSKKKKERENKEWKMGRVKTTYLVLSLSSLFSSTYSAST